LILVRRPARQFLWIRGEPLPDPVALLRGSLRPWGRPRVVAACPVSGAEHALSEAELTALACLPFDRWLRPADMARSFGVPRRVTDALVRKGLLLTNGSDAAARRRRRRHRQFDAARWDPYAALYHFMGKWRDVHRSRGAARDVEGFGRQVALELVQRLAREGPPPPHFHGDRGRRSLSLPLPRKAAGLYGVLRRRRTDRLFDPTRALSRRDLGTILDAVYGCHGIYRISEGLSVIKRTSPSGGSMHPIEVYPLVLRVEGLPAGLYHYRVADHSLARMRRLRLAEARSWADEFAAGQPFARDASVLFLLTARFRRTFWKYPQHPKAYRVLLMDAAHLSQTFYLVCTDLGLGAFFTAAISEVNIERRLGLNDLEEGAIGISACGVVVRDASLRPFRHGPYTRKPTSGRARGRVRRSG
jgi:putative peptide maturation dehydrogenase